MKRIELRRFNWALMTAVVFGVACWMALYAVWADLGPDGLTLLRDSHVLVVAEGVALVALHTFGVLFLLGIGLGAATLVARSDAGEPIRSRPHQG